MTAAIDWTSPPVPLVAGCIGWDRMGRKYTGFWQDSERWFYSSTAQEWHKSGAANDDPDARHVRDIIRIDVPE